MLKNNRGLVAIIAAMVLWGLSNPLSDFAVEKLTPIQSFAFEVVGGLVTMLIVMLAVPRFRSVLRHIPWKLAIPFGILSPGLQYILGNIGFQYGTVTTGVVLMSSEVFFLAIGGVVLLKEKMHKAGFIGLAVGVTGAIITGVAGQHNNPETSGLVLHVLGLQVSAGLVGAIAFLLVGLAGGAYGLMGRKFTPGQNIMALTTGQVIISGALAIVVMTATHQHLPTSDQSLNTASAILGGAMGTSIAFLLYNFGAKTASTRQAALSLNLIPIVAIVSGAMLGRGFPTRLQYVGIALVLVSMLALETEHPEEFIKVTSD